HAAVRGRFAAAIDDGPRERIRADVVGDGERAPVERDRMRRPGRQRSRERRTADSGHRCPAQDRKENFLIAAEVLRGGHGAEEKDENEAFHTNEYASKKQSVLTAVGCAWETGPCVHLLESSSPSWSPRRSSWPRSSSTAAGRGLKSQITGSA